MKTATILLFASTLFNLAACQDADEHPHLTEQMSRAGNHSDETLQFGGGQAVSIADLRSAWVYETEGKMVLQFSNGGLMCGEELDLEEILSARSCSLVRDGWTKRYILPKDSIAIGTHPLSESTTENFTHISKIDHKGRGCEISQGGGQGPNGIEPILRIDEMNEGCIRGSLTGLDKYEAIHGGKPVSLDWNGDFVAQRCVPE